MPDKQNIKPLISLRDYQNEVFWNTLRQLFILWKRQDGKSFTLACKAFYRMMMFRNRLCVFCSASIPLGAEFVRKEAEVWLIALNAWKKIAREQGGLMTSNADGLSLDDVCDLFEHNKLETRFYHTRTDYSRSIVVAPNPATAVGWTGDIFIDEVGRIANFKDVFEAIEPIMDSNPEYILNMATTPPPRDDHPVYEMFLPPDIPFPVNPNGNMYDAPCGMPVHRHDVHDFEAAGFSLFDKRTGAKISAERHRELDWNKSAWDRNYGCRFVADTTTAVSLNDIQLSMSRGRDKGLAINITEPVTL